MERLKEYLKTKYSQLVIWLFIPIAIITSFSHHRWVNPERVFDWDIKSYYAYLPATFIHQDISLSFIQENPAEYYKWYWPKITPTGKQCIVTSMGMSILYSPFFLIGHVIASVSGYPTTGYSMPYAFAIHFSSLFYLILGLFYLRKLLLKFFNELSVFLTLIVVFVGTNLFYYTAYAAPMSHSYNFALVCIFLYYVDKWHHDSNIKYTIILGLLSGLISLVRPTNILVLLLLFIWECVSFKDILARIRFFLENYQKVLLMIFCFILVWIPQLIYWKYVSGKFFYNSYSPIDGKFFWSNPQIFDILFSYRKGWWVYTPVMFIATLGIILMIFKLRKLYLGILIFLVLNIYVQASWWSWWFGGSFGLRAFIDSYGIMAIPLATVISESLRLKLKGYFVIGVIGLFTWYNTFQIRQLNHSSLHYWWMSRYGYWNNFLKVNPTKEHWASVPIPDYDKARKGVYVAKNLITRFNGYENIKVKPEEIVAEIRQSIVHKPKHDKYAKRFNISVDSAITIEAWNTYERKYSLDGYIRPLVAKHLSDSLRNDTIFLNSSIADWKTLPLDELNQAVLNKAIEQIKNEKF